ncbi:MAG: hypothetical protein ACK4ND_03565 [Cytophagaceae bacterium]
MANNAFDIIINNLKGYKRKFYINQLLKGSIIFLALVLSSYLIITTLEFYGRFSTYIRFFLFSGFVGLSVFALIKWVANPISHLFALRKQLSDEEAAKQIGMHFPAVSDKLLNTLQLSRKLSEADNAFIQASISQKTKELGVFRFSEAVNLSINRKYAKYLIAPLAVIIFMLAIIPEILSESTARIINYNKEFVYPAPFKFIIEDKPLKVFRNENFDVKVTIDGSEIPNEVYIFNNGRRWKMKKENATEYTYSFKNVQRSENFYFEGAGYSSENYQLEVLARPDLRNFEATVIYPKYLNKGSEVLKNAGNITVPEGTEINWNFNTIDADELQISLPDGKKEKLSPNKNLFTFRRTARQTEDLKIELSNRFSTQKKAISCYIQVIPDQHPLINAEQFSDTILFKYISLGGNVSDDYGITKLMLFYQIEDKKDPANTSGYKSIRIPVDTKNRASNFFYDWVIDTLGIGMGKQLNYYLEVWDNDGVNGHKSTKTRNFHFKIPDKGEVRKEIEESSKKAEKEMDQLLSKSKQLQKEITQAEEKLRSKKTLNWQDKKMLEDLRKKHDELKQDLDKLNKNNEQLNQKKEKFEEVNPEISQKMKELQKLMNELLDEETRKLYEELEKLIEDNASKDQIQKALDELKKKDNTLEKELERALEMFKEIKFEQKLDQIVKDLKDLAEKQKDLAEKTEQKEMSNEKLMKEQEKLNEEFENLKEDLKDLKDINESLENKKDLMDTESQENDISNEQQKSSEQLKNNQNKKAGSSQKNASDKMQKMGEEMAQMQQDMQEEQAQENIDDLRSILENLLTLSFEQEELMKEFRKINQSDPRFITLSQQQLKLKDNSQIIEDSLLSLAKRVFQIRSFVTREVTQMKGYMDESMDALRNRHPQMAAGKQQFAMTSINNLALMLSDVLKQMQEQMASSMMGSGKMCKKPGKSQSPGLGELQKQLNQRIDKLKKEGLGGQQLSEELAKLAAQQEMIRNAIKELQKSGEGGKQAGDQLSEIVKKMEETETDLVNKRITQEMIKRQQEIMTRLLEAERAMKERDLDDQRESNTGKELKRDLPPSFEKYLKAKEKQIDFLKTISPALVPYYRDEVNEYFQKIEK